MFFVFQVSGRRTRMWHRSGATCTTRPPVLRKAGWRLNPIRTRRAPQGRGSLASQAGFIPSHPPPPRCRGAKISQRKTWILFAYPLRLRAFAVDFSGSSNALEDSRSTHAGADAHRDHAVLAAGALHAMHDGRRAKRTGRAERVTERNGAAERVDLARVEA